MCEGIFNLNKNVVMDHQQKQVCDETAANFWTKYEQTRI